jgi:pyrophosphatase PpaX
MDKITTLLFDIDGTLLDTGEFIIQATEHALTALKYPVPKRDVISKNVGKAFPDYYFSLTGTHKDTEMLINTHREFQYKNFHLAKLFPGARETLKTLKERGYKLAAITTRSKKTAHQTLIDAGLYDIFDLVICNEDTPELKPSPAPLLIALKHFNEIPEHSMMIGDSNLDIEAGKNAGTKTARVTYGFHKDKMHEPQPDFFIGDIGELLNILE